MVKYIIAFIIGFIWGLTDLENDKINKCQAELSSTQQCVLVAAPEVKQ